MRWQSLRAESQSPRWSAAFNAKIDNRVSGMFHRRDNRKLRKHFARGRASSAPWSKLTADFDAALAAAKAGSGPALIVAQVNPHDLPAELA
jgi:hypothetical protein